MLVKDLSKEQLDELKNAYLGREFLTRRSSRITRT